MEDVMGDVGKRLGVKGIAETRERADTYTLDDTKAGNELRAVILQKSAATLRDFVCAECVNCPFAKFRTNESKDPAQMHTVIGVQMYCEKTVERKSMEAECPDGFNIFEKGWRSGLKTEEISSFGSGMMQRIVVGHEYSEVSPDPMTRNHLTVKQRMQQRDKLRMEIERGTTGSRYDITHDKMVFQLPGRDVTFYNDGRVAAEAGTMSPYVSERPTINWPKPSPGISAADFNREYLTDFSMQRGEHANPYVPARPKDLPTGPDTGTW